MCAWGISRAGRPGTLWGWAPRNPKEPALPHTPTDSQGRLWNYFCLRLHKTQRRQQLYLLWLTVLSLLHRSRLKLNMYMFGTFPGLLWLIGCSVLALISTLRVVCRVTEMFVSLLPVCSLSFVFPGQHILFVYSEEYLVLLLLNPLHLGPTASTQHLDFIYDYDESFHDYKTECFLRAPRCVRCIIQTAHHSIKSPKPCCLCLDNWGAEYIKHLRSSVIVSSYRQCW